MNKTFLEEFFPTSRATNIRKEICGIRQSQGETLYEYWDGFKKLCAKYPQHQISDQLLIQYFYEGLLAAERNGIDAASGGALVDKTPNEARNLIKRMASNTKQFGTRQDYNSGKVNEVHMSNFGNQMSELIVVVRQLAGKVQHVVTGQVQQVRACGICSNMGHSTDRCPTLQDDPNEQINVVGGFVPQRKYDPYWNTYNPGWRDYPNLSYAKPQGFQPYRQSLEQPPQTSNSGMSLEDMVKSLATNVNQIQNQIQ